MQKQRFLFVTVTFLLILLSIFFVVLNIFRVNLQQGKDLDTYRFEDYPSSYSNIGVRDGISAGSATVLEVVGILEKVDTCHNRPCLTIKTKLGNKVIRINLDLNSKKYILARRKTEQKLPEYIQKNDNITVEDLLTGFSFDKPRVIRIEAISDINSSLLNSERCMRNAVCRQRALIFNNEFKKNIDFIRMYKLSRSNPLVFQLIFLVKNNEFDLVLPTLIDYGLVN